jgi:hypothetical protein
MDTKYHINLVKNPSTGYSRTAEDAKLVQTAVGLYVSAEQAMIDFLADGDHKKYIKGIEAYDKFVWEASHKGDKSNLFAYKKIKVSPTWTEQIWAPIFERVKKEMEKHWGVELVLIQNITVVESLGSDGPTAFKDVDGGVGIVKQFPGQKKSVVMPVVVAEDKTGHFCKTACTNVDGIIRRVRGMNSNVLAFGITDNNISVGKTVEVDNAYGSGGVLVQQRGFGFNNNKKIKYPELNSDKFKLVEDMCIKYLKTKKPTDFSDVAPSKTSGVLLRDKIDATGCYIPPELEMFV